MEKNMDKEINRINIKKVFDNNFNEIKKEEIVGRPRSEWWKIYHPEKRTLASVDQMPLSRAIWKGETITDEEWLMMNTKGELISILSNAGPILSQDNKIIGGISAWRDITERKKNQEIMEQRARELEEAQTFLNAVIENLPTMLFVKEAEELRFVRWNKAEEELVGYKREDIIGKNDYDLFPKEQADVFTQNDRQVLDSGQMLDIPEEPLATALQGMRFLHTRKVPIHDANGKAKYLLGVSGGLERYLYGEQTRAVLGGSYPGRPAPQAARPLDQQRRSVWRRVSAQRRLGRQLGRVWRRLRWWRWRRIWWTQRLPGDRAASAPVCLGQRETRLAVARDHRSLGEAKAGAVANRRCSQRLLQSARAA